MQHLLILMLMKVHYNSKTFTGFEFSNFTIHDQNICVKTFWKGLKAAVGFALMTWKFVVNALMQSAALTHCAMLLAIGNNFGEEKMYRIILDFIVYINRKYLSQYGGLPYHLKH